MKDYSVEGEDSPSCPFRVTEMLPHQLTEIELNGLLKKVLFLSDLSPSQVSTKQRV